MLTTSTVLVGGGEAFLVDPAWMPDELAALAAFVGELRVVGGFATHAHHDHLLWHPGFGDAPRWASARTAELARSERSELVDSLGGFPPALVELMGRVHAVADGIPESAGFEIELVVHDGHAPGHTALWLPRQRVLVAGDMLSDVELPLPFDPDDVPAYLAALDVLAPYAARTGVVVPGHGHAGTDATARLDADRRYLEDVLARGSSDDPRRANAGMDAEYRRLVTLVRGGA
jgi:glyoxylase-like metal-dependent hydrolase (beta-lactamase superfamily II)